MKIKSLSQFLRKRKNGSLTYEKILWNRDQAEDVRKGKKGCRKEIQKDGLTSLCLNEDTVTC